MVRYKLDKEVFLIEDYNCARSFCSFLPGIAGKYGLPLWCFYVNRAQGIASFGVKDKDHSILEFLPANKALFSVFYKGFRTFLKIDSKFYEPFRIPQDDSLKQIMRVYPSFFEIEEENKKLGLNIKVKYFSLPSCDFASLVRVVELTNLSRRLRDLEILDGLSLILPYGCKNIFLKDLSRTLEAWMDSYLKKDLAFFKLKVDPQDIAQTIYIEGVNFYFSFFFSLDKPNFLKVVVDPVCLFGEDSSLDLPYQFINKRFSYPRNQVLSGKTPSALSFLKKSLKPKESLKFFSFVGSSPKEDFVLEFSKKLKPALIEEKFKEACQIIREIQERNFIKSSLERLNFYAQQNFLDNVLRGGFPQSFGKEVFYIYSRKHGDLERDYNKFKLEESFLSSGEGNYRDINQNRRLDIFFEPKVFKENIYLFFNLQRIDSYNPLVVKPFKFIFKEEDSFKKAFKDLLSEGLIEELKPLLFDKEFSLADFLRFLKDKNISFELWEVLIERLLKESIKVEQADFGEGFWIDHFSYNLDLVESFLSLFPDKEEELLFEERYYFYDDFCKVKPRKLRYILKEGKVIQTEFLEFDANKAHLINSRRYFRHRLRFKDKDEIYYTNLLVKLLVIVLNRLATLDPLGKGIEMEAGKPGWCDALNGLPSLFGSSLAETFELKRIILFLKEKVSKFKDKSLKLPQEIFEFFKGLSSLLKESKSRNFKDNFDFWDKSNSLKETYREKTFWAITDNFFEVSFKDLKDFLEDAQAKIEAGLKDIDPENIPTYFINEVVEYEEKEGFIHPLKFKQINLPLFLEGFVRAMKVSPPNICRRIYNSLRRSSLYDPRLKMYKVSSSVKEAPLQIGRIRVFNPGWFENESIWVHMGYKYLLEILKGGLYEEFYQDFFNCFICFLNPLIYGRSILENSSFIVSSAHPDKNLWGRGFVARLSGATAEAINILLILCLGKRPFYLEDGKLILEFKPILKGSFFTQKREKISLLEDDKIEEFILPPNCFSFRFLGRTLVIYHNPQRVNTYEPDVEIKKILIRYKDKEEVTINSSKISPPHSLRIRNQEARVIEVFIEPEKA